MMSEHTAAHDFAVRMAGDVRQSVFFAGYADPNSPGGRFKASRTGVPFPFSDSAGELTRRCAMDCFDLTAHAQRDELVDFAFQVEPRVIVLGHGEPEARGWVADQVLRRLPGANLHSPRPGEAIEC
jgi:predicted metal-dependent RNase